MLMTAQIDLEPATAMVAVRVRRSFVARDGKPVASQLVMRVRVSVSVAHGGGNT